MQAGASLPVSGPAGTDDLAASGGLEIPGRESHITAAPAEPAAPERIPGEREPDTLTHREPGAFGSDDPPSPRRTEWLDEATAIDRAREGGGGSAKAARKDLDSHKEP